MTPTIVLKDGKPFLVTGSPGGSRIITAVLQVVVDVIDRGMDIASAESAPRIHNQWMPDQVFAEPGVSPDLIAALQARGDKVVPTGKFTSVDSFWSRRMGSPAPPIRAPVAGSLWGISSSGGGPFARSPAPNTAPDGIAIG